jgi:hypothetical protein
MYRMRFQNLTYYYYRASSIAFGQVPLAIYTDTRLASTEKTQEQRTARDSKQTNPVENNRIW